jgi:Matrixin
VLVFVVFKVSGIDHGTKETFIIANSSTTLLIVPSIGKYFLTIASIAGHRSLTVLVLGLLIVMLPAPFITGRILAIAQAPIAEEKAPELGKIVFIDYGRPGKDPPGRQQQQEEDIHSGASSSTDPCGDGSSQYSLSQPKWNSFPVSYYLNSNAVTSGVDRSAARQALVNAFNTIDRENHPSVTFFTRTYDSTNAKIKVSWAAIDGSGGALARTTVWYNTATKVISKAEVVFDTGDKWFISSQPSCAGIAGSPFDIENVAVHEIGHAVGLGHVSDTKLTMYGSAAQGETLKRSLGIGDQRGIDAIY